MESLVLEDQARVLDHQRYVFRKNFARSVLHLLPKHVEAIVAILAADFLSAH